MTDSVSSLPEEAPRAQGAPPEREIAHAAMRGGIAAMAMTGMRVLTVELGLVSEPPPQAIFRQRARVAEPVAG